MFFATTENERKLWALVATVILATVLVQAFYSAYRQFKSGQVIKAMWLFGAMGIFACLNILGAINHLSNNHFTAEWDAIFFPVNLCPLAFVLIMGFQLQATPKQKSKLEKMLGLRENQWQSLLDSIHLVVIHTDLEDRISFINPFGVSLLNYKDAAELIHTQWSDHCLPGNISKTNNGREKTSAPDASVKRSAFLTRDGKQKIINWTSDVRYDEENRVVGRMYVGSDITEQQQSIHEIQELKAELEKENLESKEEPSPSIMHPDIVGKSRPFMYAIQKSKQVALTNASVLLLGETGVGKECFADLIQRTSLRASKPFIKVNCGALPAELIEDELFGHEKGAFTGAIQSRMGRFEKADGGTIFLDEIGELPLVLQPKLLRVLQNGEFERVGGHQTIKVDVRVIAATNNDLDKEVRENRFRDDLFYRLNVFPITIPPLRKRNGDIMLLIQTFIDRASREHGKHFDNISKADMNRLCDYEWPGNIRELKNVIERAVISSENNTLKLDWFYEDIEKNGSLATASLEEMETAYIVKVLQESSWKINGENGAAQKLVMHPNTLRSRMKKLKINVPWKQE
jgi:transcriptional regulator with PAS, ATPase and Fis domain